MYRGMKAEVEAEGVEFVSLMTFRRFAEKILKVAQDAEDALKNLSIVCNFLSIVEVKFASNPLGISRI